MKRAVGTKFANSFAMLLAVQTRGGILLVVNEDYFDLLDIQPSANALNATITMTADKIQWQITVV